MWAHWVVVSKIVGGTALAAQFVQSGPLGWLAVLARVGSGYNAGEGASKRFRDRFRGQPMDILVELVPFDETRGYIKRVTQSTYAFAALYEPSALAWLQRDSLTAPDLAVAPPPPKALEPAAKEPSLAPSPDEPQQAE